MDEWRPIPGFDGYEVNEGGQVRSWRVQRSGGRAAAPKPLKPHNKTICMMGPDKTSSRLLVSRILEMVGWAGDDPEPESTEGDYTWSKHEWMREMNRGRRVQAVP